MSQITKEQVLITLGNVQLPGGGGDVVSAGMISSVVIKGNNIGFVIETKNKDSDEAVRRLCESAVSEMPGIGKVTAVLTAEISGDATSKNKDGSVRIEAKSSPKGGVRPPAPKSLAFVNHIIAVGSGKGGVGKSTVAVNIAVSLAKLGHSVGLVDADIYGPSVARMMNLKGEPKVKEGRMIPPENYGIKCMSMGLILKEDVPVVWRGPMVTKALQQLMLGADWGNLDYLVLDLPPGTGDIHLSIAQNFTISGAVMVSTPQDIALIDVKKAIGMFKKVGTPILGVVENMSYFIDPESGNRTSIFGKGGVKKMARKLKIDVLGEIPIKQEIAETSDKGRPFVISFEDDEITETYLSIARKIAKKVKI